MGMIKSEIRINLFNLFCRVGIAINEIDQHDAGNAMEKTMRIALKSALMLTTRVIQIINPNYTCICNERR
jgi:hypothetical protein